MNVSPHRHVLGKKEQSIDSSHGSSQLAATGSTASQRMETHEGVSKIHYSAPPGPQFQNAPTQGTAPPSFQGC